MAISLLDAIQAAIDAAVDSTSTALGTGVVTASISEQALTLTSSDDKTLTNGVFTDKDGSATATTTETLQNGETQATITFTFIGDIAEIITENDTIAFKYNSTNYTATIGEIEEEEETPDEPGDPDDPETVLVHFQCNYASRTRKLFSRKDVVSLKEGMANTLAAHHIVSIIEDEEDED
mgnify:CR=1 FL=1